MQKNHWVKNVVLLLPSSKVYLSGFLRFPYKETLLRSVSLFIVLTPFVSELFFKQLYETP